MFLPIPRRRDPGVRRSWGCIGAVAGAFLALFAMCALLKGEGPSPGGGDDALLETVGLACGLALPIGTGGLIGYMIGRRFGRQTIVPDGE